MRFFMVRPPALGAFPLPIPMPAIDEDADPGAAPAVAEEGDDDTVGATVVTPDIGGTRDPPIDEPAIDDFGAGTVSFEPVEGGDASPAGEGVAPVEGGDAGD